MPKKPQDHKPAQDDDIHVTVRGVDVIIQRSALDDYELMDELVMAQTLPENDPRAATYGFSALRRLLSDAERTKLKDAIRNPDTGRVSLQEMMTVLGELFEAANPNS